MISRRRFLQTGSLAAALRSAAQAKKLQTIGVQLCTVRTVLPERPAETLRAIEAMGYREVEATYAGLDKIMPSLQATRLQPVSLHLETNLVSKGTPDDLARTLDEVKRRGFAYAVCPYVAPGDRGGLDVMRRLAERLNRAGEKCRAAGLKLCYHNHAFEFEPMESSSPFQVLIGGTDKNLVGLELDLFWVSVAGHDPAEMLRTHAGRVRLVHLKDKAGGTPLLYKESVPRTAFKEVGRGVLDWPKILRAAESAGVEHYFVEQDQTPADPLQSLRESAAYLRNLEY